MRTGFKICLFIFAIIWCRTLDAANLTTAKLTQPISARATTLHRRLYVQRDEEESTTVDIFRTSSPNSRRNRNDIWNWDFWCQMQPKTGNCDKNEKKYYYDTQLDQCLTFDFTGCDGNKNQFKTKVDCERHCKGAAYMPIKNSEENSPCSLQPSAGMCLGYVQMYYYDVNLQLCHRFAYGGCGGNGNRFETNVQCMSQCGNTGIAGETDSDDDEFQKRKQIKNRQDSSSNESV